LTYELIVAERARKDLRKISEQLNSLFVKHFIKLKQSFVPREHLKYSLPYFVEKVTNSTRFSFQVENNIITVVKCFKNHKEYEEWYNSL